MKKQIAVMMITLAVLFLNVSHAFAQEVVTVTLAVEATLPATVEISSKNEAPMPSETVVMVENRQVFEMSYSEPGEYQYTVRQIEGDGREICYDKTVYDITVYVVRENDHLQALVSANKANEIEKETSIIFWNSKRTSTNETESQEKRIKSVQTGDGTMAEVYLLSMIVAAFCIAVTIRKWVRNRMDVSTGQKTRM